MAPLTDRAPGFALRARSAFSRGVDAVQRRFGLATRPASAARRSGRTTEAPAASPSSPPNPPRTFLPDVEGAVAVEYTPAADGDADPGEVVWAWVPYEEMDGRGKDRPVLVIGRQGPHLLALQLSSKDHDADAEQEARAGRHWMDVGSGAWDRRGRASEVRLDRVLRLDPAAVRREGVRLDPDLFGEVTRRVTALR